MHAQRTPSRLTTFREWTVEIVGPSNGAPYALLPIFVIGGAADQLGWIVALLTALLVVPFSCWCVWGSWPAFHRDRAAGMSLEAWKARRDAAPSAQL